MKAQFKNNYPILKSIFKQDETVEITMTKAIQRIILNYKYIETGKTVMKFGRQVPEYMRVEDQAIEIGQLTGGYTVKVERNGKVYPDTTILNLVGYKSLGDIFTRI